MEWPAQNPPFTPMVKYIQLAEEAQHFENWLMRLATERAAVKFQI